MFGVQDWAEVHRLDREGVPKRAIARRLQMSHTTVHRLLGLCEPPRYERRRTSSLVDPFASEIAAMLDVDPKVPATVVLQHLRRSGYGGGITILKEHLATVRPSFLAARCFQRTSYLPGEISQIDWWHTGCKVPVGKGAAREAFGLVATLPHSAAHAGLRCREALAAAEPRRNPGGSLHGGTSHGPAGPSWCGAWDDPTDHHRR